MSDKDNEKKKKEKQEKQILIEDGTMAEFGFENPCEIKAEQ